MLTTETEPAQQQTPEPAPLARGRPGFWRRITNWLRPQTQFSLSTLLEWMLAYAAAFLIAWTFIDRPTLARTLGGVLVTTLLIRAVVRTRGRRLLHYFVLVGVILLGLYCGPVVLRESRLRTAAKLIEEDKKTLAQIDADFQVAYARAPKNSAEAENLGKSRIAQVNWIRTRDAQLQQVADDLEFSKAPLPANPEEWSPLCVPVEKRIDLKVTFDFVDHSLNDAKNELARYTGLQIEYAPGLNAELGSPYINLRVTDMSADLSFKWIMKLCDLDCSVDKTTGKITIRRPEQLK